MTRRPWSANMTRDKAKQRLKEIAGRIGEVIEDYLHQRISETECGRKLRNLHGWMTRLEHWLRETA